MNENLSQFELLPNEILMDIFQAFYNLNIRFNNLIKSIYYLSLTISKENQNEIDNFHVFSSYLYTLIIDDYINININSFKNIRRLILINPTDKFLTQFDNCILHNLEYLSIKCVGRIPDLYKIIFSNSFPNLKSCYNLDYETIRRIDRWRQSPMLRILKIGYIKLSICPYLYYLDFSIFIPSESSSKIEPHVNLKQLILRTSYNTWSKNETMSVIKDIQ